MIRTLTLVVGALLLGGAATASADALLTGDQIADGTIDVADLDPDVLDPTYPRKAVEIPASGVDGDLSFTFQVRCPSGTRALNGGIRSTLTPDEGDVSSEPLIERSYPTRSGWALEVTNALDSPVTVTAFAVCL